MSATIIITKLKFIHWIKNYTLVNAIEMVYMYCEIDITKQQWYVY